MPILEIAHPNDIVLGKWREVGEFTDSEIADQLASPEFEWYEGLCVRIILGRSFRVIDTQRIYSVSSCVHVGPWSTVVKNHPWSLNDQSNGYLLKNGWIQAWAECDNALWMMNGVLNFIPLKTLVQCAARCVQKALTSINRYENGRENAYLVADAVYQYVSGDITEGQLNGNIRSFPVPMVGDIARAIDQLVFSINSPFSAEQTVFYALRIIGEDSRPLLAEVVREQIPFYEIAVKLVKGL